MNMNRLPPEAPEEGFIKTESGIFIPEPVKTDRPNRETRRQIGRQVKSYNRQQTRLNKRRNNG